MSEQKPPSEDSRYRSLVDALPDIVYRLETELRRQAVDLEAANEALREANEARARLVSMLVHDLRTPLTVITATLELLSQGPAGDDLVEVARKQAEEMSRLVDEALELYGPGGAAPPLVTEELHVTALLEGPVRSAAVIAALHGIRIEVRIGPDLPLVSVDLVRMRRAVANLLSNAVKHSRPGGVIVVSARGADDERRVEISVEDQGEGIPPEDLPHLFDPYYQARNARKGGTGLGLAVVRRIAEAHGGSIAVESEPGRGARFTLRLPAAVRALSEP